jgi:alpha-galactosidase
MPGEGDLVALVNGAHSSAGPRLVALLPHADSPPLTSYGALGLSREARSLALAFDPDDPGEGKVTLSPDGLDAVSDWAPARPVRPEGDTSRMRLCYLPGADGVEALRTLFVPTSQVDRQRLASTPAPTGWSSGRELRDSCTEADVISQADFCAEHFDRRFLRLLELGEGYERAAGDWDTNDRFSHGHRWLTDQIHSRGFQAGLWLAPFAVSERSGIPAAHADWLVRNVGEDAPAILATQEDWGGRVYALDGAHPAARQWLFDLARRVVQEWGYDYVRLDRLRWATARGAHYGGLTPAEAYRLGLSALRDGAGSDVFLHGCDAPLQHSVGFVNGMRVGPDRDTASSGIRAPARAAALRSFYHRGVWLNDTDTLTVGPPLSFAEARLATSIVAVSGDITVLSDDLVKLDPERLALLDRALPVAPSPGRPIGVARDDADAASDRPASTWIAEGAPRWWTVVLANWEEETREHAVSLTALGLTGARFNAYDVWRGEPLPDVTEALTMQLDAHSCIAVGLRPAAARPQVIGTTRHVVQGALDVVDEAWDAATRTLHARASNLDGRAYGVTIAVPKGMRPATCKANVPCSVRALESGHAVLEWAAGAVEHGTDVSWKITFRRLGGVKGKD